MLVLCTVTCMLSRRRGKGSEADSCEAQIGEMERTAGLLLARLLGGARNNRGGGANSWILYK